MLLQLNTVKYKQISANNSQNMSLPQYFIKHWIDVSQKFFMNILLFSDEHIFVTNITDTYFNWTID